MGTVPLKISLESSPGKQHKRRETGKISPHIRPMHDPIPKMDYRLESIQIPAHIVRDITF